MGRVQLVFVEDPCGGSRGSDHCACLTGSDVTGSHVTFPITFPPYSPYFFPYIFPYFFPVLFYRTFLFPYFFFHTFIFSFFFRTFSRTFSPRIFFSSSSTQCWLGSPLRRSRPITIGNYYPFYFHILGVLYDVRVLLPYEAPPFYFHILDVLYDVRVL
jgi:hypothetical protein